MITFAIDFFHRRGFANGVAQILGTLRSGGYPLLMSRLRLARRRAREQALLSDKASVEDYLLGWKAEAAAWFAKNGRRVEIVIPSYRDATLIEALLASLVRTTDTALCSVTICDDASGDQEHIAALKSFERTHSFVKVIYSDDNVGFAQNVNRALSSIPPELDVVLMNSDIVLREGWLSGLQYSLANQHADIIAPKLLYANGTIQFAGGYRNISQNDWFDHIYRFKDEYFLPALTRKPVLFATGAAMYITAAFRRRLGLLDPLFPMAFEDVDYCLRCWTAGGQVAIEPRVAIEHHESQTRGKNQGDRELRSKTYFWQKHEPFFLRKTAAAGAPTRVIFVTQDSGVGGGHRVIFHHLTTLAKAGYHAELWNLAGRPDWYELDDRIGVRAFRDYNALVEALSPIDAIKIATWWETAEPVWRSSVIHGVPAYLVQDIESSYYEGSPVMQGRALASYRPEFNFLTNTKLLRDRLQAVAGLDATDIGLGYDAANFGTRAISRDSRTVLIAARGEPLKCFAYAVQIVERLRQLGWRVIAFGLDRHALGDCMVDEFILRPSDERLCSSYNRASLFLSTSTHEGFALPPIEAMACGCLVASTDAVGNMEYLRHGENALLIPHGDARTAVAMIEDLFVRPELCAKLRKGGFITAESYDWRQIDKRLLSTIEAIAELGKYARPVALD